MITIKDNLIFLETEKMGYYLYLHNDIVECLHYGSKIHPNVESLKAKVSCNYGTDVIYESLGQSLLHYNLELSPLRKGDYQKNSLNLQFEDGSSTLDIKFKSYEILTEISPTYPHAKDYDDALKITYGTSRNLQIELIYLLYSKENIISKQTRIINKSKQSVTIKRCMSYQLDMENDDYDLTTFVGTWANERNEETTSIHKGTYEISSTTGNSSHYCNPFFMISSHNSDDIQGNVYGFNLIYSGSFQATVSYGPYERLRIMAGISDENLSYEIKEEEIFETPFAIMTYSNQGRNGVSQNMHSFVNDKLIHPYWQHRHRPIVINNWESTYFDFKESDLIKLAKQAKELGIELFVLDDGWFSTRNNDTSGLGDYDVNQKKIPSGLKGLSQKMHTIGLDFGLWVEPEMTNPDSKLFKQHPDWIIQDSFCLPSLSRNQYILDLTRKEVQDYIIENLSELLEENNISYLKWDMNRHMSDIYDGKLELDYIKGLYTILDAITRKYPNVLIEGCASGGNRFDLGILSYCPQIWTSDNTDSNTRLHIQSSTSYGYPLSTMSNHVSAIVNHQTLRNTDLETKFDVACFGVLGYELDLSQLSAEEKKIVKAQITFYKEHRDTLQFGYFYHLKNHRWLVQKEESIVLDYDEKIQPNSENKPLRLHYLEENQLYSFENRPQKIDIRTFGTLLNTITPIKVNPDGLLVNIASHHYMLDSEKESYQVYGSQLNHVGIRLKQHFVGTGYNQDIRILKDDTARLYVLKKISNQ